MFVEEISDAQERIDEQMNKLKSQNLILVAHVVGRVPHSLGPV
jgi:hypothetical protein